MGPSLSRGSPSSPRRASGSDSRKVEKVHRFSRRTAASRNRAARRASADKARKDGTSRTISCSARRVFSSSSPKKCRIPASCVVVLALPSTVEIRGDRETSLTSPFFSPRTNRSRVHVRDTVTSPSSGRVKTPSTSTVSPDAADSTPSASRFHPGR